MKSSTDNAQSDSQPPVSSDSIDAQSQSIFAKLDAMDQLDAAFESRTAADAKESEKSSAPQSSDAFSSVLGDFLIAPLKREAYDIVRFAQEMHTLSLALHPSIIKVQRFQIPGSSPQFSSSISNLAILRDSVKARPLIQILPMRANWTQLLTVCVQLSRALQALHKFNFIYGEDLSPENILITALDEIKLGHVDFARYLLKPPTARRVPVRYRAPELSRDGAKPTQASDVYAFGGILFAMATGKEPWDGLSDGDIQNKVVIQKRVLPIPKEVDQQLAEIIEQCTAYEDRHRPTFDTIATQLDAMLMKATYLVPTTQVAPFGFANLSDTNFGPPSTRPLPAPTTSLVESKEVLSWRMKLWPMTDDAVTLAREKFLSQMGTIDPYMIVAKRVDAPSFYVVHRANGNVVLVTSGLWDPNETLFASDQPSSGAALPGIELLAEAKESEVPDLSNSWLYQCLLEVACTVKRNGPKLRRLLRERQYATLEVMDVKLPPEFLDPTTGRACMLLGIEGKDVPKEFQGRSSEEVVTVVTARLLTLAQWRDSQEFAVGKKSLGARFVRDGTCHISCISVAARVERSLDNGDNKSSPSPVNESCVADPSWTLERINKRLEAIKVLEQTRNEIEETKKQIKENTNEYGVALKLNLTSAVGVLKSINVNLQIRLHALQISEKALLQLIPSELQSLELLPPPPPIVKYEPPIPTGVIVSVRETGGIATVMDALTQELRRILAPNSVVDAKTRAIAQTIYGALATQSQLYGWQHVSEYIRNPRLYMERKKPVPVVNPTEKPKDPAILAAEKKAFDALCDSAMKAPRGPSELHEAIDGLQETGHDVIKRFIYRVDWFRSIYAKADALIPLNDLVRLIGTDLTWMAEANAFMKSCEETVAELLAKNPQRFNQFRELQKKGIQWPHSPELRTEIEKAGFVFRPMMIKRDRCVCDHCEVEVSGWRPWHDPKGFHDVSKPHPWLQVSHAPATPAPATTAVVAPPPATTPESVKPSPGMRK